MGIKYNLKEPTALWGEAATKPGGAKSPEFLSIIPRGLIPVIQDPNCVKSESEGLIMHDSAAILTYLALSYNSKWYPFNDPLKAARINFWFGFSAGDIQHTLLKVILSALPMLFVLFEINFNRFALETNSVLILHHMMYLPLFRYQEILFHISILSCLRWRKKVTSGWSLEMNPRLRTSLYFPMLHLPRIAAVAHCS